MLSLPSRGPRPQGRNNLLGSRGHPRDRAPIWATSAAPASWLRPSISLATSSSEPLQCECHTHPGNRRTMGDGRAGEVGCGCFTLLRPDDGGVVGCCSSGNGAGGVRSSALAPGAALCGSRRRARPRQRPAAAPSSGGRATSSRTGRTAWPARARRRRGSPRVGVGRGRPRQELHGLLVSTPVCAAAGGLLVWELEDSGGVDAGLIWGRSRTESRLSTGFL
jgi:hypothetical protein